jgi:hypothetical protein
MPKVTKKVIIRFVKFQVFNIPVQWHQPQRAAHIVNDPTAPLQKKVWMHAYPFQQAT